MNENLYLALDSTVFCEHQGTLLAPAEPRKHPSNPILRVGDPGSADDGSVAGGSIIPVEDGFRLYYLAMHREPRLRFKMTMRNAVAFSHDGIHWTKPALGRIEFNGSRHNNLLEFRNGQGERLDPTPVGMEIAPAKGNLAFRVWRAPEDYAAPYFAPTIYAGPKASYGLEGTGNFAGVWDIARSEDGILFTVPDRQTPLVAEFFEHPGLFHWRDRWFLCGQIGDTHLRDGAGHGRQVYLYTSDNLRDWTRYPCPVLGMDDRYPMMERHVDIAAVPYGRLLIGFGGIYHGGLDQPYAHMDVSLVFSHDGFCWREFDPVFTVLRRGNPGEWDGGSIIQIQGIVRTDTHSVVYYAGQPGGNVADQETNIGCALYRRDGFAFITLRVGYGNDHAVEGRVTTASLPGAGGKRLRVNADRLSSHQTLHVEVLDEAGQPIRGFEAADFTTLIEDGVDLPARWGSRDRLPTDHGTLALRFVFKAPCLFPRFCPRLYAFTLEP